MAQPEYLKSERKALVGLARLKGMSDAEILRKVIVGVLGTDARKRLIVEWGDLMGFDAGAALRTAQLAGLVLTARLPRSPGEPRT